MNTIRITTSQNIDIDYEFASLGERIFARLIDYGILIALLIGASIAEEASNGIKVFEIDLVYFSWLAVFGFYDLVCEAFFNGQSVGKRMMKIKVISLDGSRPSLGQYIMRWIFRLVDFVLTLQLGALLTVVASRKKQRIGDMVAGTAMIRTHPRTNFDEVAFGTLDDDYSPMFPEASQLTNTEVALIHQVLNNVKRSNNVPLLYQTATRLKEHLNISSPREMDDQTFLETLIKDYNYAEVNAET